MEFDTRNGQRGAALLVAVGILAVLLALALVFFGTSRQELRTAQNARNSVQADWLAQAGTAMAMAELQRDSVLHPTATSLDGKWRSYFNGTWFLAKDWAVNPLAPHLPQVDAEDIYAITGPAGLGLLEQDLLYVPRAQGADPTEFSDAASPFLLSYAFDAAPVDEQLHAVLGGNNALRRYGVDNNGDGLLDSYWMPVPEDIFFGGMDNNADTLIDAQEGGDGIDNDLDGDIDEADERALFVYWGGRDGRDNDGDGIIDEADEQRAFLTAPIVQRVWNDTDSNPDNHFWEELTLLDDFTVQVNLPVLEAYAADTVSAIQLEVDPTPGSATIDVLDNDYSLINNDSFGFVYLEAGTVEYDQGTTDEENYPLRYEPINIGVYPVNTSSMATLGFTASDPDLVVTASGEPVCRIAGRVAVLITDEASRVNLNTAAGISAVDSGLSPEITFAGNQGTSPFEYEARTLPNMGPANTERVAQFRGGIPHGDGFSVAGGGTYPSSPLVNEAIQWDMAMPGYGRADDDGNAFWASIDGIDNDGDGIIDEFSEGVDEPSEYRVFRPQRNRLAEGDFGVASNNDDIDELVNEIGEAGDQLFYLRDRINELQNIGPGTTAELRDLTTVYSRDRNRRTPVYETLSKELGIRETLGQITPNLKQDFNYSLGLYLATAMQQNWFYPRGSLFVDYNANPPELLNDGTLAGAPTIDAEAAFARGLRVYDRAMLNTPYGNTASGEPYWFDADPELRALQIGASLEDFRDSDHARTEWTTALPDMWWSDVLGASTQPEIRYTVAGTESIRINEIMARPVRRIEAEADTSTIPNQNLYPNLFSLSEPDFDLEVQFLGDRFGAAHGWSINGTSAALGQYVNWSTSVPQVTDGSTGISYPNVIQFRFKSSPGLPPGRYYLMVNTMDAGGNPTITNPSELIFAVKQAQAIPPATDILDDIEGGAVDPFSVAGNSPAQMGYWNMSDTASGLSGMVMLPSREDNFPAAGGYGRFEGYTVEIPDFNLTGEYLYVALAKVSGASADFAVNFFDFSQEPDHEWIEIVNVAERFDYLTPEENAIDLGGWQLAIGPSSANNAGATFTIPLGTKIAAGGSLLLGFNKFDSVGAGGSFNLGATGIALAQTSNVTAPPIPDYASTSSVFLRVDNTDFYDNDGDGVADANGGDDELVCSTPDDYDYAGASSSEPNKAWDRIVDLQGGPIDKVISLSSLANLVLGGGFLPNTPEYDGVDNDRDSGILRTDAFDNNQNGIEDEAGEGVDEGRYARDNALVLPGGYRAVAVPEIPFTLTEYNANMPPDFKAFIERRFYPGDNVVVTIYQGPERLGRIADRVTYTQRDVENRAINDILDCPYDSSEFLDGITPYFWPDNTMGVDFYRSLERKHPLFDGDLYGTANRWEATDGNYDDWHEGTNRWMVVENPVVGGYQITPRALMPFYDHGFVGTPLRPNVFARELANPNAEYFEDLNPGGEYWAFEEARVRNRPLASPGDLLTMPQLILAKEITTPVITSASNPNDYPYPYPSALGAERLKSNGGIGSVAGPLLGQAYPKDLRAVLAEGTTDSEVLSVATAEFMPIWPLYDPSNPSAFDESVVQWDIDAAGQVIYTAPRAWSPVFLMPLNNEIASLPGDMVTYNLRYAQAFPQGYPIELNYIFNTQLPAFAGNNAELQQRWPLERRITMYTAQNVAGWTPDLVSDPEIGDISFEVSPVFAPVMPSEALFVWRGDAAVPNGEYDVYLAVGGYLDGKRLLRDHVDSGAAKPGFTPFGAALLNVVSDADSTDLSSRGMQFGTPGMEVARPTDLTVDVAVFTDADGDNAFWTDHDGDGLIERQDLNDGRLNGNSVTEPVLTPDDPAYELDESFGLRFNLVPHSNGSESYVHYGPVEVRNNVLGVLIRNGAKSGMVNRFSRVILAPRRNTPGRVNINTAVTRLRDFGNPSAEPYNVLLGLPGVLGEYIPGTGFNPRPFSDTTSIGPGNFGNALAIVDGTASIEGLMQNRGRRETGFGFDYRADGRYFLFPSELVARGDLDQFSRMNNLEVYPRLLSPTPYPGLEGINGEMSQNFDEMKERYSRMAAMITTRSDTFEIIVTAQAGIVTDEDGDGIEDWTGDEFVVLGEKKLRTVYERP